MRSGFITASLAATLATSLAPTLAATLLILASAAGANAQSSSPGFSDAQRNCQTIRTCRFERGGSYRGCLSSYTCRTCKLVKARCEIGGRSQNCQEMRCTWGG